LTTRLVSPPTQGVNLGHDLGPATRGPSPGGRIRPPPDAKPHGRTGRPCPGHAGGRDRVGAARKARSQKSRERHAPPAPPRPPPRGTPSPPAPLGPGIAERGAAVAA